MRKIGFLLLFLLAVPMMICAQELSPLTLEELIPGGKNEPSYTPKNLKQLSWVGDRYLWQRGDSLLLVSAEASRSKKPITLSLKQINQALAPLGHSLLKQLPDVTGTQEAQGNYSLYFQTKQAWVLIDAATAQVYHYLPLEGKDANFDYHAPSHRLAFTRGNDLYACLIGGTPRLVAHSDNPEVSFGASGVHRNEFGVSKGTFWSPTGEALAFYRLDQSAVKSYPLVHIGIQRAELEMIKYPMAGESSESVQVEIYRFDSDTTVALQTPRSAVYLTNLAWTPDEKELLLAALNRRQDSCKVQAYNTRTGRLRKTLFEENSLTYVEPQQPPRFLKKYPDQFLWESRRNGYNHLYRYHLSGELLQTLTQGAWEVISVCGENRAGTELYVTATADSPLQQNPYRIRLSDGKRENLSEAGGMHTLWLNDAGSHYIDSYSNHATPRKIYIGTTQRGRTRLLLQAENPFEAYSIPQTKVDTLTAADGATALYYRLTLPLGFDPTRKYPVIVYLYGGAHLQLVTDSWMWGLGGWDHYMARRGYIVFTLDNRGSANRGAQFEQATHLRLGIEEARDQLRGIDYLSTLSYVDTTRIGVMGWSFGGHLTTRLLLTAPEKIRVGVAGGPVTDWRLYEVMYTERYMRTPQSNPSGYRESDLNAQAGALVRPLLLIHGDEDPVVLWQHSLRFLKASVAARTYPDYLVYPGHPHNVRGKDRVHLFEKITRYMDQYLQEEK